MNYNYKSRKCNLYVAPPSRRRSLLPALGFALATLCPPVAAWGPDGHRIVCRIAYGELTPVTRRAVDRIIEGDARFGDFPESCNWPDQVRKAPRFAEERRRHYLNVAPGSSSVDPSRDCPGRCVLEGIRFHAERLGTDVGPGTRAEALAFLAHYVGDVHQPLHVAFRRDMGGNKVPTRYRGRSDACRSARCDDRRAYDLHWLWDSVLIGEGDESWKPRADRLRRAIDPQERRRWSAAPMEDWADESYRIVVERVYPSADDGEISREESEELILIVERRLQQAGVRLAATLERRLAAAGDREPTTAAE